MKTGSISKAWIFVGILGLGLATACGDGGGDGDAGSGASSQGGGSGGEASGGGTGTGTSTGVGGGGTCNPSPWSDDAACQTCLGDNCCFALNACEAGSECIALNDCLAACAGDILCSEQCVVMHEGGVNAVDALANCNTDSCQGCASVPPTTYDACAMILAQYPGGPYNDCVADHCCSQLVACDADPSCDVASTLVGDAAPSSLMTCIIDSCLP
ncbi:MAG: hypothetical protein R3B72_36150 [Polyangiaceae bacterium]